VQPFLELCKRFFKPARTSYNSVRPTNFREITSTLVEKPPNNPATLHTLSYRPFAVINYAFIKPFRVDRSGEINKRVVTPMRKDSADLLCHASDGPTKSFSSEPGGKPTANVESEF